MYRTVSYLFYLPRLACFQSMRSLAGTLEHPHRMKAAFDRGDYEEVLSVYSKVRALSGQTATTAASARAASSVEFMVRLDSLGPHALSTPRTSPLPSHT